MSHSIVRLSSYGAHLLHGSFTGNVHSAYRTTVNIVLNKQLLALQSCNSPLSPISLITELAQDSLECLAFSPGQHVLISPGEIKIFTGSSHQTFTWKDAAVLDLKLLSYLDRKQASQLILKLKEVLSTTNTDGFEQLFHPHGTSGLSPVLAAAKKHIDDCTCFLSAKDYSSASASLTRLIGLGTGLTPSGDDFLCGLLAGLMIQSHIASPLLPYLSDALSRHLNDTNDISAAFLSCALQGQFSLAVNSLCHLPDVGTIRSSFLNIGHSSGMDTLCGVLYALQYASIISP